MKKEERKQLDKMSIKELQSRLQEMETEKMKLEITLRMNGYSSNRFGYGSLSGSQAMSGLKWSGGNLNNLKKNIARIKTKLNIKLLQQNETKQ